MLALAGFQNIQVLAEYTEGLASGDSGILIYVAGK